FAFYRAWSGHNNRRSASNQSRMTAEDISYHDSAAFNLEGSTDQLVRGLDRHNALDCALLADDSMSFYIKGIAVERDDLAPSYLRRRDRPLVSAYLAKLCHQLSAFFVPGLITNDDYHICDPLCYTEYRNK